MSLGTMASCRSNFSTEQKLDMALEELVDRVPQQRKGGYHEDTGGSRKRHAGDHSVGSKNKVRRRVPAEDKALLNTQCFQDAQRGFVVKLYETEVFVLRRKAAVASSEGDSESASGKDAVETASGGAKVLANEQNVVMLNTGRFRTIETKYILNEALRFFGYVVAEGGDSGRWTVTATSGVSQPFEDNMEMPVTAAVSENAIREHLMGKIAASRDRQAGRRPNPHEQPPSTFERAVPIMHPPPPQGWGYPPPFPGPHPQRPPPGWVVAPPRAWPPAYPSPQQAPPGWAPPWAGASVVARGGPHPGCHRLGRSRSPRRGNVALSDRATTHEPLPDSMFQ
eukprot:TRINITY_DN76175_c0_g1_i1.p1 TRINITY_DN76175_c0_g1~~TRINITY_DN76175_c0_g1_i1.p1  ORF type:complete len:338 (+),score=52.26 TRINITY_DN76175_c0_g1_i1:140-1153(+)